MGRYVLFIWVFGAVSVLLLVSYYEVAQERGSKNRSIGFLQRAVMSPALIDDITFSKTKPSVKSISKANRPVLDY